MNVHQVLLYVDAASVTLVVVLAGRFARGARASPNAWLVVMLGVVVIAYVLSARDDYRALLPTPYAFDFGAFHAVLNLVRNAGAGVFALLCHRIFRPGRAFPVWLICMIAIQLGLEEPVEWLIGPAWEVAHPLPAVVLYEILPAALQIAFLGVTLYWILAERDADLVEARRQTRTVLLIVYLVQALFSLGLERIGIGLGFVPAPWMYPIHALAVSVGMLVSLGIVWALMPADVAAFVDPLKVEPVPPPLDTDTSEVDAARIRRALQDDHVYRQAGLTVAGLARQLALPEYRLRRLIHGRLGYRNFNALLHDYRIAEVSRALADPEQNGTPVLTLALSAGYQSLTPFNRAFKSLKGMTPTEYRFQTQTPVSQKLKSSSDF